MSFDLHRGSMKAVPHQPFSHSISNLLDFKFMQRGAICSATMRVIACGKDAQVWRNLPLLWLTFHWWWRWIYALPTPHLSVTPDDYLSTMKVQLLHSLLLLVLTEKKKKSKNGTDNSICFYPSNAPTSSAILIPLWTKCGWRHKASI